MTGIKQSNFTQVTSVDEADNIPLFTGSENKRITYANMRDQLADEIAVRFIYPTTAQLQQSNLEADEDEPNYVRCEETEYRLYKITALAAGADDIALDNGMTATYQEEYSKSGFVLGAASSTNNALALFDGTTGAQLKTGAVLSTIGGNLASATSIAQVSYPRVDASNAVTMATPTTLKTDLNLPSNTASSISAIEGDISTIKGDIVDINSDLATKVQTVETWAAISTVTPSAAGQVFTLKQHTSGGLGGGTLMAFVGSVTDDGVNQKNCLGGFYLKRCSQFSPVSEFLDLLSVPAAVGDVIYVKRLINGRVGFGGYFEAVSGSVTTDNINIINSATSGVSWNRINEKTKTPRQFGASHFGTRSSNVIMLLGDSNAEGVGSTDYTTGYMGLFCRAAFNAQDLGENCDRGFRYETNLNMSMTSPGISGTGTLLPGTGVSDYRLSLAAGQSISVVNREISSFDVFYDATLSTGQLEFYLNGVLYKTVVMSGTGIKNTYPSYIINGDLYRYTLPSDTVQIKSVGGTVVITGMQGIRTSSNGSLIYCNIKAGWGFDEFADTTRSAEAAEYLNAYYATSTPRLIVICLGTNNMVAAAGRQKTPDDYIAALSALIARYNIVVTAVTKTYAIWVPPRPNVALPLGTYEEYVSAIVEFCAANGYHCIRTDLSGVGEIAPAYLSDTLHYSLAGHDVLARTLCDSFGIAPNFGTPAPLPNIKNTVTMNTPWASSGGGVFAFRSSSGDDVFVRVSGTAQSNASPSLIIGSLPANCRPKTDQYGVISCRAAGGARPVIFRANGDIEIDGGAVPVEASLDGCMFVLRNT